MNPGQYGIFLEVLKNRLNMKIKITLLLVFISFCSFTTYHKFYVSVTEIEHNKKAQSLQIISRVFIDDFENLLKMRYNSNLRLGKDESSQSDGYIKKYLNQKMEISVDGMPLHLNYIGKEYENDMILFYIEAPNVTSFRNIEVKNSVLMDLFEEQKNLVHVKRNGDTKSLVLASGKERDVLNFGH